MPSIIVPEGDPGEDIARKLIAAARPDRVYEVRTSYSSGGLVFDVPDDIAAAAGFGDGSRRPAADTEEAGTPADTEPQGSPAAGESTTPGADTEAPPRTGKGSGVAAWREFLTARSIEYPADAERDDLVAIWESHTP